MKLAAHRFLNLIHHVMVSNMDEEQARAFEERMEALSRPIAQLVETAAGSLKPAPSWWRGDDEALENNLAAAAALGFAVGEVT